jgi:cyanophycinase
MFAKYYGANTTWIPVTANSGNGNDPFVADVVRKQTGFFFEGGDQMRLANALRPEGKDTLVLQAVKEVLRNGGMVGGLSAGTACQVRNINSPSFRLSITSVYKCLNGYSTGRWSDDN